MLNIAFGVVENFFKLKPFVYDVVMKAGSVSHVYLAANHWKIIFLITCTDLKKKTGLRIPSCCTGNFEAHESANMGSRICKQIRVYSEK